MKIAVKTLLIVAPWLVAATLPICLFPDFAVDSGSIAWSRLAFFDFVLVPLSPILLFRWCWTNPESTFSLLALLPQNSYGPCPHGPPSEVRPTVPVVTGRNPLRTGCALR